MPYKLKANAPEFDCVDGPFAGKKYRRGEVYADVPPGDKGRFETVRKPVPATAKTVPSGKVKKNDASDVKKASSAPNTRMNTTGQRAKGGSK